MRPALQRSAWQVAAIVALCAGISVLLTLLEGDRGSSFFTSFAGYFHPFLSLGVAVAAVVKVIRRRLEERSLIVTMVVLLALMAASPKRVFNLYPYTTLGLLALLVVAFASLTPVGTRAPGNQGGR